MQQFKRVHKCEPARAHACSCTMCALVNVISSAVTERNTESPLHTKIYLAVTLPAISDAHYVFGLTRNCKRPLCARAR